MPKLPRISTRRMIAYLAGHGYAYDRSEGSHRILRKINARDELHVPERKELGRGTITSILNKAGIDRDDFVGKFDR